MDEAKKAYAQEMGRRIRQTRRVKGMTQAQLAEAAGVSRDALVRLESARGESRPSTVTKVAEALGLDYQGLLPPQTIKLNSEPLNYGEEGGFDDEFDELLALARRRAEREGITEEEALGFIYKEHALLARVRGRRRFGLPLEARPVMSRSNAGADAVGAVRGG